LAKRATKDLQGSRTAGRKRPGGERSKQGWRLQDIQKLIDSLVEREISEFEMEQDGLRIHVRRGEPPAVAPASLMTPAVVPVPVPAVVPQPASPPPAPAPAPAATPSATAPGEALPAEGLHIIKSPIVGTFYRSASPKAEPFVKVGDVVREGQVLCIIEAMKLMNEIESEVEGKVARILVENGQPVEYGQPLFAIKPSVSR
jgi:acetyl-CoA carboxylase biotin carboxyl carrier protein